jgi:hypothetical protein
MNALERLHVSKTTKQGVQMNEAHTDLTALPMTTF